MFAGHYSAALAAKAAEPRAPLWTYMIGCQLLDVAWAGFVMAGVEKVRIDPSLPGSPLDLYDMPFTHSLPGALAWSMAGALVVRFAMRLPVRAAVFVGLTVFSHWVLDLIVHRPDLELGFGGYKAGLALWNHPLSEQAVEIGLLAVAAVFWTAWRLRVGRRAWPAALFVAFLVILQIIGIGGSDSPHSSHGAPSIDTLAMGATALLAYLLAAGAAWLAERGVPDASLDAADRLPATPVRA
ncbi:MAG TPA: hypothetical protein VFE10_11815 [Phenylobacterium sp.]|jgi:hypothetical protein|nr:hypothetical protein [Phenylobacterium sp.]